MVIEPAMVRIGELWQDNAITVADEHLATAISHSVLVRLFDALATAPPRSCPKVLLAAPEGQHHVLGLRMIADVLEGAGFDVLYLGPDVPVRALSAAVAQHQPAIVGLSFAISSNVANLAASILAVHEAHPEAKVMLGGRAVPPALCELGYPVVDCSLEVQLTTASLLARPEPVSPDATAFLRLMAGLGVGESREHAVVTDPVAERLAMVAEQTADRAREYVRAAGVYRDLALRDPVTGLGNRRAFEDQLYADTRDGLGAGLGALLMIDVDEFKAINDTHGHDAGDELLRFIGVSINQHIRAHDFAARVGGDEFAVILPRTDLRVAGVIGERICESVRKDSPLPVSVSIGMAALREDTRSAVLAADSALYEAKTGGRDRVAGPSHDAARTGGSH
jgi:diguanylate cyclase (GGDEF)-like protein